MKRLGGVMGTVLVVVACGTAAESPISVETTPLPDGTRLTIVPRDGYRISARAAPALELADGSIMLFDAPGRTALAAYFDSLPRLETSRPHDDLHGTVRASVCETTNDYCRVVEVEM
jgi:hypothetical protein